MILSITGYRPDKLPNKETGYKIPNPTYNYVCQQLEKQFRELKPEKINSGMALGVDSYAAAIAYKLKIPYAAIIPFEGQELKWNQESQKTYRLLRKLASEEVIVSSGGYQLYKMHARNQYLVDHCDILIAVIRENETSGGTYSCVEYAKSIKREIIYIDPSNCSTI